MVLHNYENHESRVRDFENAIYCQTTYVGMSLH